mgnify:CR=1 FL=1
MERRKIRDSAEARRCLAAAASSGLPRAAWAHAQGLDARSLNAWRMVLDRAAKGPSVGFVELVPRPAPTATYRIRCGAFEVEVTGDFDEGRLGRLLRLVASC